MNLKLLSRLYYIFTYKLNKEIKIDDNFSLYFKQVLNNSHILTKVLVTFFLILLNYLSLLINFKSFQSLSLENSEIFINKISKFSPVGNFFKIIKVYSYIYCFEKNK